MIALKANQRFVAFATHEDGSLAVYVVDGPDIEVVTQHLNENLPQGLTLCEVWPDYDIFDLADSVEHEDPDISLPLA